MNAQINNVITVANRQWVGLITGAAIILSLGLPWAVAEDASQPSGVFPLMGRILSDGALAEISASVAFVILSVIVIGAAIHMNAKFNGKSGLASSVVVLASCLALTLCPGVLEHVWIGWVITVILSLLEPLKAALGIAKQRGYWK